MATNFNIKGSNYYRMSKVIGKKNDGTLIRKYFYGKNKKDAEEKKNEYLKNLNLGLDNSKNLLCDIFKIWLFEIVKIKTKYSTFDRYEGIYRNYIKHSELNNLILLDIKNIQIQRFLNNLAKKNKSFDTIKSINNLLKYFFSYCVQQDYIFKNPALNIVININKLEKKCIEPFTDSEIKLIKEYIKNTNNELIFLLGLGTGLRQGEILALTLSDIDFNNCELRVNKNIKIIKEIFSENEYEYKTVIQDTKTKNSNRIVPIPKSLIDKINNHIENQKLKFKKFDKIFNENMLIFTTENCLRIDARNLLRSWERILKNLGIKYRNFHNLRHTYASKLFENDVPLKTVSDLLGHSDINITANTYTHVMPRKRVEAVEQINYLFD